MPRPKKPRLIDLPEVQEAIRLTRTGLFAHEVAAHMGLPATTVKRWLTMTGMGLTRAEAIRLQQARRQAEALRRRGDPRS